MLRISEFSRLTQVPAKTLRYYDEIGLFCPAAVDPMTSYRYYSVEQLPRLNRILALKYLGLSLNQIAQLLDENLSAEQIRGMLRLKRAESLRYLEEEQIRLAHVESILKQIEMEGKMPVYDVVLKKVEPLRVASVRDYAPDFARLGPTLDRMFDQVNEHITRNKAEYSGKAIALYHDPEMNENIDIEAAISTDGDLPDHPQVKVRILPGAEIIPSVRAWRRPDQIRDRNSDSG
jgi:DNA-binding transcriptional MerR regulator